VQHRFSDAALFVWLGVDQDEGIASTQRAVMQSVMRFNNPYDALLWREIAET
jgi:hypothetical protein